MINCIAQEVRIIDADNNVTHTFDASKSPAIARRSIAPILDPVDGIPVVGFTTFASFDNLPLSGDILVALAVVEAMRALGIIHDGRVYTPQPLRFNVDRKPIGTPGLIFHWDVSR